MSRKKQQAHNLDCVVKTIELQKALKIISAALTEKNQLLPTGCIRLAFHSDHLFLMASSTELVRTTVIDVERGPDEELLSCPTGKLFIGLIDSMSSEYVGLSCDSKRATINVYRLESIDDEPDSVTATIGGVSPEEYFTPPVIPETQFDIRGSLLAAMISHVLPACSDSKDMIARPHDALTFRWYGDRLVCFASDTLQFSTTTVSLPYQPCEFEGDMMIMKWNADALRKTTDQSVKIGHSSNKGRMFFVGMKTTTVTGVLGGSHVVSESIYDQIIQRAEQRMCAGTIARTDLENIVKTAGMFFPSHEKTHAVVITLHRGKLWIETPNLGSGKFKDWIEYDQETNDDAPWTVRVDAKRMIRAISGCDKSKIRFIGSKSGFPFLEEVDGSVGFIASIGPLAKQEDLSGPHG